VGLVRGLRRHMEIILSPCDCTGMMRLSAVACGSCVVPSMIGTFGPYTSASSNPTLWPSFAKASARFTATVVLPTPPFPLATATRFFTPGMCWRSGCCIGAGPGGICFPFGGTGIPACPRFNQSQSIFARGFRKSDRPECLSYSSAVALLVLLPRAAGASIVAAHFCANLYGPRGFGLRGAGLILQILLLALLFALELAGDLGEIPRRWFAGSRGGRARGNSIRTRTRGLSR